MSTDRELLAEARDKLAGTFPFDSSAIKDTVARIDAHLAKPQPEGDTPECTELFRHQRHNTVSETRYWFEQAKTKAYELERRLIAALRTAQPAAVAMEPVAYDYDYTRTFNALAKAVWREGNALALSPATFWKEYGCRHPAAAPEQRSFFFAACALHGVDYETAKKIDESIRAKDNGVKS